MIAISWDPMARRWTEIRYGTTRRGGRLPGGQVGGIQWKGERPEDAKKTARASA